MRTYYLGILVATFILGAPFLITSWGFVIEELKYLTRSLEGRLRTLKYYIKRRGEVEFNK